MGGCGAAGGTASNAKRQEGFPGLETFGLQSIPAKKQGKYARCGCVSKRERERERVRARERERESARRRSRTRARSRALACVRMCVRARVFGRI